MMLLRTIGNKKKTVFVALSGGVDSSVAALLLKKQGFRVRAGFIRGYNVDGCQDNDLEDARAVAQRLDIPFYVFDFQEEYKERVVDYCIDGYRKGITPNPDVLCNSAIKFGLFYEAAMRAGADYVATGHYARLRRKWSIKKLTSIVGIYAANDTTKDQSYFLWQVPYEKFQRVIFPLGKLKKKRVRAIAKKAHLLTAEKKDSQGVCFLGKFNFKEFLQNYIPSRVGDVVDRDGKKVGQHEGVWFYTIGQGHGMINTAGKRFYVIQKDIQNNRLIVAYEGDETLLSDRVVISSINWLDGGVAEAVAKGKEVTVLVRTRYRAPLYEAIIKKQGDAIVVRLDKPVPLFAAEGQSVVLYNRQGKMIGGGIIVEQ